MFGLKNQQIEKMQAVFAQYSNVEEVILYGSRAKGNFRTNSDIDLTLKGADISLSQQFKIELALDDLLLPYQIDLSIYQHIQNDDLLAHIERVGVSFYINNTSGK